MITFCSYYHLFTCVIARWSNCYKLRINATVKIQSLSKDKQIQPFFIREVGDTAILEFSSNDKIKIQKIEISPFNWMRTLFDGSQCKIGVSTPVQIVFRVGEILLISSAVGNHWIIYEQVENEPIQKLNDLNLRACVNFILKSLFLHVLLLAIVLLVELMKSSRVAQYSASLEPSDFVISTQEGVQRVAPFSGIGFSQFVLNLNGSSALKNSKSRSTVHALSRIGNLFRSSGRKLHTAKSDSMSDILPRVNMVDVVDSTLDNLKKNSLSKKTSKVVPGIHSVRTQEQIVAQGLNAIKPKLSRSYDYALRIDPSMSIALSYEAQVNEMGYLSNVKFQSKGQASPDALAALERGIRNALLEVHIGKVFKGKVIKGEHVFIH